MVFHRATDELHDKARTHETQGVVRTDKRMGKIYEALERAKQSRTEMPMPAALNDAASETPVSDLMPRGFSRELVVLDKPGSQASETFRYLRSLVVHPAQGDPPRTLLVTSALSGEGKTYVASNLAVAISQGLDEHVLLVDADLRAPRIHRVFGLDNVVHGLSTHLDKQTPLEQLLRKTSLPKLTILPGGNSTHRPAELLTSDRMRRLIREVRDRYEDRFVLFDSTPLELTPETYVLANEVDAILFVVRRGVTPRRSVQAALEKIRHEKLLGIVFNGDDAIMKRYRKYGYYKGYGREGGKGKD